MLMIGQLPTNFIPIKISPIFELGNVIIKNVDISNQIFFQYNKRIIRVFTVRDFYKIRDYMVRLYRDHKLDNFVECNRNAALFVSDKHNNQFVVFLNKHKISDTDFEKEVLKAGFNYKKC